MHTRQGIIGKDVINSVRQTLQRKYEEDSHIQHLIEELKSTEGLTYEELQVTRQAHEEVSARLFYTGLLDSLWQEIEEAQDILVQLHVYESLEREFSDVREDDDEEFPVRQVELEDVPLDDASVALRPEGTVASRHDGSVATRQDGTVAARHDGSVAPRHDGTVAARQDGSVATRQDGSVVTRQDGSVATRGESGVATRDSGIVSIRGGQGGASQHLPALRPEGLPAVTSEAALALLTEAGVSPDDIKAVLTKTDWKDLKKFLKRTGKLLKKAHKIKKANDKAAKKQEKREAKHAAKLAAHAAKVKEKAATANPLGLGSATDDAESTEAPKAPVQEVSYSGAVPTQKVIAYEELPTPETCPICPKHCTPPKDDCKKREKALKKAKDADKE